MKNKMLYDQTKIDEAVLSVSNLANSVKLVAKDNEEKAALFDAIVDILGDDAHELIAKAKRINTENKFMRGELNFNDPTDDPAVGKLLALDHEVDGVRFRRIRKGDGSWETTIVNPIERYK